MTEWLLACAVGLSTCVLLLRLRGALCLRPRTLRGRRLGQAPRKGSAERGELTWGGVPVPRTRETSHFLLVGTTGSGKTLSIQHLLRRVLERKNGDERVLVYDAKGDARAFLQSVGAKVKSFNPFEVDGVAWDMARDIESPANALQVAGLFIPEEEGSNRFFSDAARDLMGSVLQVLISRSELAWTLRDVLLVMRSAERLEALLSQTATGREVFGLYFADQRTASNIMATVRSRLGTLEPIAALWSHAAEALSLRDWLRSDEVLVLGSEEAVRLPLESINSVLFQRITELVLASSESRERRTWFFLDEVREAGRLGGLPRVMTKGRSKGACVVLGCQDIGGLKEAFGERVALEMAAMCSHKAFLRLEGSETAEWAAKLMGEYEAVELQRSVSSPVLGGRAQAGRSEQRMRAAAVLPTEFLSLPPVTAESGMCGYYLVPGTGGFFRSLELRGLVGGEVPARGVGRRTPAQQVLRPWSEEDEQRLGLCSPRQSRSLQRVA